jgi:hypothetical protein
MNLDQQLEQQSVSVAPRKKEREERPKNSPKEDLNYMISGLEKAKTEPGMTNADIAALDRAIAKWKEKLAAKKE